MSINYIRSIEFGKEFDRNVWQLAGSASNDGPSLASRNAYLLNSRRLSQST